jgi:two-component system NtrC family sensor kinase
MMTAGDAPKPAAPAEDPDELISRDRYRRMLVKVVLSVSAVALLPLLTMSAIAYYQYQNAFRAELTRPMLRFAEAGKQSLESFLSERLAALALVLRESRADELRDPARLDSLLAGMKQTFGGIVDLGLIDEQGVQVAYAGPYALTGRSYAGQPWFQEALVRGSCVSDVFLGYRNLPHIVVAVHRELPAAGSVVLRATIDTDVFHWLVRDRSTRRPGQESVCLRCHSLAVPPFSDAFIINDDGVLQTPSRLHGDVLTRARLPALPHSTEAELIETADADGRPVVAAWARIARSPFTLVLLSPLQPLHAGWRSLGRELVLFPSISAILILAIIVGGAIYVVRQSRNEDRKRAALYHKMEYTNKLAAIGRLGAGVAHEINNPLAIITQKAGLLKDLLTIPAEQPSRERMVELIDSVLKSAERCGGITHRLLGFAKHMDVQRETIDLDLLLREVLGFLEKEAAYRSIRIDFVDGQRPPPILSDRSQLQQVFLNIINNAFAAVEDGGRIEIGIRQTGPDALAVSIADNGVGIPESQMEQIFDPFFTTKKGAGTGLGLSITYGIVQKLGGQISVQSTVGEGTCFTVTLPIGGQSR